MEAGIEGPPDQGEMRVFVVCGHLGSVAVCAEEPGFETRAGGLWTQLHWDSRLRKLYSAGCLFIGFEAKAGAGELTAQTFKVTEVIFSF